MAVPNIFGTATAAIPLSQLDQNFATAITIGNTAVYLGNTTTSLGNVTLTNVTISSGNVTLTGANVSGTANVTTLAVTGEATVGANVTASAFTSTSTFGFKNRIINGAMVIDQRRAGASATVTGAAEAYLVDRFFASKDTSAGTFTVQQTPSATETGFATRVAAGFTNYSAITIGTAWTAASGDGATFQQRIEGLNISDLAWGTANAKTVTLSFLVYSSLTGTFSGSLVNSAFNRSYPFTYSIPVANTWTQISITIAGDQSGTWLTTNGIGMRVYWDLGSGSGLLGTANAWTGSGKLGVTGSVALSQTAGATFYITGVQLEKGSTATSFDYRPFGTELALCQRYFYKTFPQQVAVGQNSGTAQGAIYYIVILAGANYMGTPVFFPVTMRATPTTLTFYNPQAANAKWRNTSLGTDSGSTTVPQNLSQYGFTAINNPQVAGDAINNSIIIHATAEAEL